MRCPECSQKVEPETILCPRCSIKAPVPATSQRVCDIFLMGFSDPSSQAELVDFLSRRSFWRSQEDLFARLSGLPVLVCKKMDRERARFLREELEGRGGIVELRERQMTDRGSAKKIIRETEQESEAASDAAYQGRGGKGYLLLFLISLIAVVYLGYHHDFSEERKTVQNAVRKLRSHLPAGSTSKTSSVGAAEKVSLSDQVDSEGVRWNNEGVSFIDEGRYAEAVEAFQNALSRIPDDLTILQNLQRAWMHQGYEYLGSQEYEQAILAFEEAIRALDNFPEVYKLMGMAAMHLSDDARAEEYYTIYLNRISDDPEAAGVLGQILYKQNRLEEAVGFLRIYLAANPGDTRVQDLVNKALREVVAEDGFEIHEGANFDVRYDGVENTDVGYVVVGLLEDAYQRIGAEMNFYPEERSVTILYSDEDFRLVTQTPDWTRGVYDGKIRIPIGGLKDKNLQLERVVAHEYTHALIHQMTGGKVATWLNEGLAQYFEGEATEGHRGNAHFILRSQEFIPLNKLEASFLNMDADTASLAYTQSFTVVEHIIQDHGIYAIQRLLSELAAGTPMESALTLTVGAGYTGLQEEWLKYLARKYS